MRQEDWLWYANVLGNNAQNTGAVLARYETPEALLSAKNTVPQELSASQLEVLNSTSPSEFIKTVTQCKSLGVGIVNYSEPSYPEALRDITNPPPVLYYKGDITILNNYFLFAIIGTRRPSGYGIEVTRDIAKVLTKAGVVLVSGLAEGLDSEAHKAAIAEEMPTVACLAFGHSYCYPAQNRTLKAIIEQVGVTISEYPPEVSPQKAYFLARNRIIAGISRGVCVAEARRASGTMNTVGFALEYGKDIFSVPGSIYSPMSEGTNALLREGASPVTSAADILDAYAISISNIKEDTAPALDFSFSTDAAEVKIHLSPMPKSIEVLCSETKMSPAKVMACLTELELSGAAKQIAGRQFIIQ
ncbi:MAG: DNA-processing protein DprA [Oscillospiraceae bacterium]